MQYNIANLPESIMRKELKKKKICVAQVFHGLFHLGEGSGFSLASSPYRQHFGLGLQTPSALPRFLSRELLRLNQLSLLPGPSKHSSLWSFRKATLSTIQRNCCLILLYLWVLLRLHLVATDMSISSPFNIPSVQFKWPVKSTDRSLMGQSIHFFIPTPKKFSILVFIKITVINHVESQFHFSSY